VKRPEARLLLSAAILFADVVFLGGAWAAAQASASPAAPAAGQNAPAATAAQAPPEKSAQAPAASPTDIAGTWQGTLHIAQANRDLRIENRISKDEKGNLKVLDYSIDQGGMPMPANKASFEGGVFKYSIDAIGGSYEGTMSPDGKKIIGKWTQGPGALELDLDRVTEDAAWPIPEPPKPMAADADPAFEVATIKPNDSGATEMRGLVIRGREFRTNASSLQDLIGFAYSVQAKQVIDGPPWMSSDRYDIEAVPDQPGVPNVEQIRVMMRKMMADRFQLKFHHEQREMSAYVLEVSKGGEKLTPNDSKANLPGLGFGPAPGGITIHVMNARIDDFTGFLQILVLDRPVVNRTGLTGKYNFSCAFAPDDSQFNGHPPRIPTPGSNGAPSPTADAPSAPSLYEALEQQDGLKLTAQKTMVDVIVIDHVDKPSAN